MDEPLQRTSRQMGALVNAEDFLEQAAEDAQDLGQPEGARIMRQAAVEVRKVMARFDLPKGDDDIYTLRGR